MPIDSFDAQKRVGFFRTESLKDIALHLLKDGPHKQEGTPRRVRGLFQGSYIFDTTAAYHIWEHPYYPQFYIPKQDLQNGRLDQFEAVDDAQSAYTCAFVVNETWIHSVLAFEKGALAGLVRFTFDSLDAWFEEDQRIYGHPKDPYKRIDILPSSRKITTKVDGVVVAESTNNMFLYETMLRPRYYMPLTSAQWQYLTPSEMTTLCPYKGMANYYNVVVSGKEHRNLIWWYKYPTAESAPIAGHMCFYNEKVEILIDGQPELSGST